MRFTFSHSLHRFLDPSCRKTGWLNHFFLFWISFLLILFLIKGNHHHSTAIFIYLLLPPFPEMNSPQGLPWKMVLNWIMAILFFFHFPHFHPYNDWKCEHVWCPFLTFLPYLTFFFIHNPPPSYYAAIGKAVLASFSFGKSSFLQLPLFFILNEIHFNHDEPSSISHCAWQTCSTYLILFFKKSTSL